MRVSLVFPPFYLESLYNLPPLGLLSLGAALSQGGHAPRLHDHVLSLREGTIPMNADIYARCAKDILAAAPDLAALSCQATTTPAVLHVAAELKRLAPDVPVVVGGHNASFLDRELLTRFPAIDVVVRGEGEATMVQLADALSGGAGVHELAGIAGLSYRDAAGAVRVNPDRELLRRLDDLPLPDYGLAPELDRYRHACGLSRSIAILEVGRGCPHACAYCSEQAFWRRRVRTFSPKRIVSEMKHVHKEHGAQCFLLSFDQFTADRSFAEAFCRELLDAGLPGVGWYCISRLDTVDAGLLALMREAGCESMCYGIDSGSKRTLSVIGKDIDEHILFTRVRESTDAGLKPTLSFILGFPHETLDDLDATVDLALRCCVTGGANPLVQLPTVLAGTRLHREYADRLVREVDTYFSLGLEFDQGRRLPGDEALITAWPDLFSCFHNLPFTSLPLGDLADVADNLPVLLGLFPKTFALLRAALQASPTLLFRDLLDFIKAREGFGSRFFSAPLAHAHFRDFVADRMATAGPGAALPHLEDVLRYEEQAIAAAAQPGHASGGRDKPALNPGVLVAQTELDVALVTEDLRAGRIPAGYPRARGYTVFENRHGDLTVFAVNRFGADLLALCDGKRPVADIARTLHPDHAPSLGREDFLHHCHEAVGVFRTKGLVHLAA